MYLKFKWITTEYNLQATKFMFPSGQFLLLNTYFMCDPQQNNFDDNELLTLLEDIRVVIDKSLCSNILWLGDLNTDFSRNSRFVHNVKSFIESMKFKVFWSIQMEKFSLWISHIVLLRLEEWWWSWGSDSWLE
jgi:hypothetical protein